MYVYDVVWIVKTPVRTRRYVVGDRCRYRARMTYVPVAVYHTISTDGYTTNRASLSGSLGLTQRKGYDLIRIPYPLTFDLGAPMTNTVYGNAWEDLSGLGEQYVENNQGWENVAGGITTVNWFKYLHYAPYLPSLSLAISMMGTRFG
jgi:hypothetical protein